jgi:DNA-binding MarR family transcriptional regulator
VTDSPPVERTLLGLISDVQIGLSRLFRERTKHIGLSRAQWRVLSALSGRPGITQTELADLVGIGRAPLGKIIDRLQAQNWVERRGDPDDRRINRLFITRDFKPIAEPTRDIGREISAELLKDIPLADREAFHRTLCVLHKKLGFGIATTPDEGGGQAGEEAGEAESSAESGEEEKRPSAGG